MRIQFRGWKHTGVRCGLAAVLVSLGIGCTNSASNTLPNKGTLPPPKTVTGTLPVNSPAYNNMPGMNPQATGASPYGMSNPAGSPAPLNAMGTPTTTQANGTPTMPTTRIGAPEGVRPDARAGMNPIINTPANTVNNPASFNGPSGAGLAPQNPIKPVGFNTPAPIMAPLPGAGALPSNGGKLPGMSPVPGSSSPGATTSPGATPPWPTPGGNAPPAANLAPINPASWNSPAPVPPAPPTNPASGGNSSSGLQPLKLPESISSAKPVAPLSPVQQTAAPAPAPVPSLGAIDPVDATPAPILAPPSAGGNTKVISTFPPKRENVPPVVLGSDDIPAAPLMPGR